VQTHSIVNEFDIVITTLSFEIVNIQIRDDGGASATKMFGMMLAVTRIRGTLLRVIVARGGFPKPPLISHVPNLWVQLPELDVYYR